MSSDTRAGKLREWSPRVLAWLVPVMMVLICADRRMTEELQWVAWLALALGALLDKAGSRSARIGATAGLWLLAMAGVAAGAAVGQDVGEVFRALFRYFVPVIWLAVAWVVSPLFMRGGQTEIRGAALWTCRLLVTFALAATVSAGGSLFPEESMDLLGGEVLPYTGLFVLGARMAGEWGRKPWAAGWRASAGVMGAVAFGFLAVLLLFYAPLGFRDFAVERQFFRVDDDAPGTWRLQFVFDHHNRAGFFLMAAAFVMAAVAAGGGVARGWRVAAGGAALAALFALPFTLTRGALVAAGVGIGIIAVGAAVVRPRRWMLGVAALLMVLPWFFLPDSYQHHIRRMIDPASYQVEGPGSISARFRMWDEAFSMIEKRPAFGFGYGFENFEAAARYDHPEDPNYFKHAVHAHNMWLETAAESGLPAAALLLAFTLARWAALTKAWWRESRRRTRLAWILLIWIGLETAIFIYGLGNYPLRRNLGFLVYALWSGSVVLAMTPTNTQRAVETRDAG